MTFVGSGGPPIGQVFACLGAVGMMENAQVGKVMSKSRGFTLIELMITIAVMAILLSLALPSFQQTLRSNRVATTTNELLASLSLARSEAIRNTHGASLCPSADGTSCGTDWNAGWLVWGDTNDDGTLDSGETVLRFTKLSPKMTAAGPSSNVVTFDGRGRRASTTGQSIVLAPDQCGGQELKRTLEIGPTGQVKTTRSTCT